MDAILGTKVHMKQAWTPAGVRVPITVVKSGPNIVTQVKKEEKDGYQALQIGFGDKKLKSVTKPLKGHFKGALKETERAPRFLREVKSEVGEHKVGEIINPSEIFEPGDVVQVTGISKGKGFAGVVKRWGFAGGPKTHGQSDRLRAPGSIGQGTTPGRVFKGKKMAGRMGAETKTVKGLVVLSVAEDGEIELSGAVPGSRGGLILIKKTGEKRDLAAKKENVEVRKSADTRRREALEGKQTEGETEEKTKEASSPEGLETRREDKEGGSEK